MSQGSAASEQLRASDIFAPLLLLGRTVRLVRVWVIFRNQCRVQSLHAGPICALWIPDVPVVSIVCICRRWIHLLRSLTGGEVGRWSMGGARAGRVGSGERGR